MTKTKNKKSIAKRFFKFFGLLALGILLGISVSFYFSLRMSVPQTDGTISIPSEQINSDIEITFDSLGIPQIWADNDTDAFFALGYQHAADRLFQLDFLRRIASGRLSEMFGSRTLEFDKHQRQLRHTYLASEGLKNLLEPEHKLLQAYANGINYYKDNARSLSFEFFFLPVDFQDWTVLDCLTLFSFQTWHSNALLNNDSTYVALVDKLGELKTDALLFPYPDWAPVTVKGTSNLSSTFNNYQPNLNKYLLSNKQHDLIPGQMSLASNGWVISGDKTKSGKPYLASDPHLLLNYLPQFWYTVGLHSKESNTDILGITVPGLPMVVMGHNHSSAYAFTAGGTDINDYIIVTTDSLNSGYYDNEQFIPFTVFIDSFFTVSANEPIVYNNLYSNLGAVLSIDSANSKATIHRWAGIDADFSSSIQNGLKLHQVSSFEQFQQIVTNLGAMDANMLYADTAGDIGYQLTSPVPIRPDGFKNIPVYESENSWINYYQTDQTPSVKNPPNGWIASANNKPIRSDLINGYYYASRIISLEHLLTSQNNYTLDDMAAFQLDITERYLLRFTPMMSDILKQLNKNELSNAIANWDGQCTTDSKEIGLITIFLDEAKKFIFEDELPDFYHRISEKWLENITTLDSAGWFDNVNTSDVVETKDETLQKAMLSAIELSADRTWAEMTNFEMKHPLSAIPGINTLLGLTKKIGPYPGTKGTLNAAFYTPTKPGEYDLKVGPSWRFLIDMANPDSARMVLPYGNSGNPMSDHFNDFYQLWKNGEYWVVPLSRDKVFDKAVSTLKLTPLIDNERLNK